MVTSRPPEERKSRPAKDSSNGRGVLDTPPEYVTLDGSLIRELVRPEREGSANLSLAEAIIAPGQSTHRHLHRNSEEIYYVLCGEGIVQVGARPVHVCTGQAVLIKAGQEHSATCYGSEPLRLLCACSPPYQDQDTELTEGCLV